MKLRGEVVLLRGGSQGKGDRLPPLPGALTIYHKKMKRYNDETVVSTLTVADLKEIFRDIQSGNTEETQRSHGRLVYGLRGIQELFNCSHKSAQYYKDHIICEAVNQNGRKIVVDADLALKLFNERRAK